jgi:ferredoxin
MCEFCTQHGEGQKWYLQMKNYSAELLHTPLSDNQQRLAGARTRLEWNQNFWQSFVLPAWKGVHLPLNEDQPAAGDSPSPSAEEELVEAQTVHFGQVIPIEDVAQVIGRVDSITRIPCGCRFLTTGKTDQRYCFGLGVDPFGILGRFPEASACMEVLEKDEAMRMIRRYDQDGLIHSIWTGMTPYVIGICNCDHDCGAYRWTIEQRRTPDFFRAEYVCQTDWERCTGCKLCMSQCQFGAQFYSHAQEKVYIDPGRCYGCGVCRAACPNDAIQLLPRQAVPAAANRWLS